MKHSEVASYIIQDTFDFTKKSVKKASTWSLKTALLSTLILVSSISVDFIMHIDKYEANMISPADIIFNQHRFQPRFINELSINTHWNEEQKKESFVHNNNYTPIVSEFSTTNNIKNMSINEKKEINNLLAQHYKNVCDIGLTSKIVCTKYSLYQQINNAKNM